MVGESVTGEKTMANVKPIKWRKVDEVKLAKSVRKFNASLTRLSKQNPEIFDAGLYPDRVTVSNIKDRILSRTDYNREIARLNRWFDKGARDIITKSGIKMTRYAYKEATYDYRRQLNAYNKSLAEAHDNLRKQAQLGNAPISPAAKLAELETRRTDSSENNNETPENLENSWAMYLLNLSKRSSDKYILQTNNLFYTNYVTTLYENLTPEHANDIQALMYTLQLTGYEMYLLTTINPDLDIEYLYGPEKEESKYNYVFENLYTTYWKAVRKGLIDMR